VSSFIRCVDPNGIEVLVNLEQVTRVVFDNDTPERAVLRFGFDHENGLSVQAGDESQRVWSLLTKADEEREWKLM
jgi:hypothetical protein